MTTEAIRRQSRRLELGNSLNGFLTQLGLSGYTGRGKRGDAKRLREQMERLFRSRFSLERVAADDEQTRKRWLDMQVAPQGELWWSVRAPDQGALWGSWIELGELFYAALASAPVPVDMRALRALKRSPLALDLYAWLTFQAFRAHQSQQPRFESWAQMHSRMGGSTPTSMTSGERSRRRCARSWWSIPHCGSADRLRGLRAASGWGTPPRHYFALL